MHDLCLQYDLFRRLWQRMYVHVTEVRSKYITVMVVVYICNLLGAGGKEYMNIGDVLAKHW